MAFPGVSQGRLVRGSCPRGAAPYLLINIGVVKSHPPVPGEETPFINSSFSSSSATAGASQAAGWQGTVASGVIK